MLMQSCVKSVEVVYLEKYSPPPADENIVAVGVYDVGEIEECNTCPIDCNCPLMMLIVGDKAKAAKSIGKSIEPWKLVEDNNLLSDIVNEYIRALREAKEKNLQQWSTRHRRIAFITQDKVYIRDFNIDREDGFVFDSYMKSKQLFEYFKELGLIPKIKVSREKNFIPSKDETIAVFVCPYVSNLVGPPQPVAVFGDLEEAEQLLYGDRNIMEKLTGRPLEPKMVFDCKQLEEVRDIYAAAEQKVRDSNWVSLCKIKNDGSVVFVAENGAYAKPLKLGEKVVIHDDMESKQLFEYFNELALIDLLQSGTGGKNLDLSDDFSIAECMEKAEKSGR